MISVATGRWRVAEWLQQNLSSAASLSVISLVLMAAVFQALNPAFLSYQGLITLVYAMSYFLIAALGLTFVIMMGSFDFSVVSVMKLAALLCVMFVDRMGLWVIPVALAASTAFGALNGFLFARLRIPSFMATLGVSVIVEGLALMLSKGFLHMVRHEGFRALAVTFIGGLPAVFYWAMGVWAICTVLALLTPFGRRTYAIGGNPVAATVSGINVEKQRILVFMLSSFLSGLAGVLYMAQLGGGSVGIGGHMIIPLFASVVAGGTVLTGGVGGPHRTLFGVLMVTWIQSGLLMLGTDRSVQVVVLGIIAILMTMVTTRQKGLSLRMVR